VQTPTWNSLVSVPLELLSFILIRECVHDITVEFTSNPIFTNACAIYGSN